MTEEVAQPPTKKQKTDSGLKSRKWVLTIYADEGKTFEGITECPISIPDRCSWLILSLEQCPSTGRYHLQGACYYKTQSRLSQIRKDFGSTGHYEVMRGNIEQNVTYCSKDATHVAGPWEFGKRPSQGKRSDWEAVKQDAIARKSLSEITMAYPHLAPCQNGIRALIEAAMPPVPIERPIEVWYLFGPTDVGKTHRALMAFPDAYVVRGKYREGKSFDQYEGQDVLVFDEWDPLEWPLTEMNMMLDKWKCPLACRYQNKYARWTKVVITSNIKPSECYSAVRTGQRESFMRRLTNIYEIYSREDPVIEFIKP